MAKGVCQSVDGQCRYGPACPSGNQDRDRRKKLSDEHLRRRDEKLDKYSETEYLGYVGFVWGTNHDDPRVTARAG